MLGIIAYELGKFDSAVTFLARAVEINPQQAAYFNNLGNAHKSLGSLQEAVTAYKKALALRPDYAEAHNNLGVVQKKLGDLEDAVASFEEALRIRPNYIDAHYNLGNALQENNDLVGAINSYKKALNLNPNNADALYNLANALQAQDKYDNAIAVYKLALRVKPDYVEALERLGNAEQRMGDIDAAMDAYEKALHINPEYAVAYCSKGIAYKEKGDLSRAEELLNKALQINPELAAAHCQLSFTKRHTEHDNDIRAMEILLAAENRTDKQKMHLNFGLGKAFEDLKQYDKAFDYILEGNRLKRNTYDYTVSEDQQLFDRIQQVFSKELFAEFASSGSLNETPVFILGMPRSGTTLLEQILSSHPQVHGAGELHYIQSMIQYFCCGAEEEEFPGCMKKFSEKDYGEMGEAYIERI
jgi:tetratricopeptide (TPR) repeat protein